jgi:hypothetical protein
VASGVYVLCAITCLFVAILLVRQYTRRRSRLLLWAAVCFVGLTVNNALLFVDFVVYPSANLAVWRGMSAVVSIAILLYGLIWDTR